MKERTCKHPDDVSICGFCREYCWVRERHNRSVVKTQLRAACENDVTVIADLYQTYMRELSRFVPDAAALRQRGVFKEREWNHYFGTAPGEAFLVLADEAIAGFALITPRPDAGWHVTDFFVARQFAGWKVSWFALRQLLAMHDGDWSLTIDVRNKPLKALVPFIASNTLNIELEKISDWQMRLYFTTPAEPRPSPTDTDIETLYILNMGRIPRNSIAPDVILGNVTWLVRPEDRALARRYLRYALSHSALP